MAFPWNFMTISVSFIIQELLKVRTSGCWSPQSWYFIFYFFISLIFLIILSFPSSLFSYLFLPLSISGRSWRSSSENCISYFATLWQSVSGYPFLFIIFFNSSFPFSFFVILFFIIFFHYGDWKTSSSMEKEIHVEREWKKSFPWTSMACICLSVIFLFLFSLIFID